MHCHARPAPLGLAARALLEAFVPMHAVDGSFDRVAVILGLALEIQDEALQLLFSPEVDLPPGMQIARSSGPIRDVAFIGRLIWRMILLVRACLSWLPC